MGKTDDFVINLRPTFCCSYLEDLFDQETFIIEGSDLVFNGSDEPIKYCPYCGKRLIIET